MQINIRYSYKSDKTFLSSMIERVNVGFKSEVTSKTDYVHLVYFATVANNQRITSTHIEGFKETVLSFNCLTGINEIVMWWLPQILTFFKSANHS